MAINQQQFFDTYAQVAIEQQIRYGIPASLTLAQMALESSYGNSELARKSNNFFGMKVGSSWTGAYDLYSDDHPNEKFRHYDNVMQSIDDHSKILMGKRYSNCHEYGSTDFINWTKGIKKSGYATDKNYVTKVLDVINANGLKRYDQMAVEQARQQNLQIGYMRGSNQPSQYVSTKLKYAPGNWCLPINFKDLNVTGNYLEQRKGHLHGGIDISTKGQNLPVYATEDNGKVVAVSNDPKAASGNMVTIEYSRQDGIKYQTTYMHLSQIGVQKGDLVNAGSQIGMSGNTGRSTGPHLHFETKRMAADGTWQRFDPKDYLAEIEVRGNLNTPLTLNGEDVLAQNRSKIQIEQSTVPSSGNSINNYSNLALLANITNSNDPAKWLAFLLDKNGETSSQRDVVSELISTLFSAAMSVALSLRTSEEVEKEEQAENQLSESTSNNVIKMSRETVDVNKAQQTASAIFETETADNIQQNTLRQA